jgi:hypothetical protein
MRMSGRREQRPFEQILPGAASPTMMPADEPNASGATSAFSKGNTKPNPVT